MQDEDRLLSNRQADEQAYVAQTELLKFILSGRYSFTPLNLANAMAGLPYMQWRQSSKRCGKMECRIAMSSTYRLFKILYRASQGLPSSQGLTNAVQNLLQNSRKIDYVAAELRKNWYHLRAAIKTVTEKRHHPGSVPFRVLTEYQRRMRSRTSVDLLLEEEHGLR